MHCSCIGICVYLCTMMMTFLIDGVIYRDVRHPVAPLRSHASTHSDDITSVRFSRDTSKGENILLSASSDGLLSVSNANEDDEDEAVTGVGNWGCSISKAGWTDGHAWAASDMETLSIWNPEVVVVCPFLQ